MEESFEAAAAAAMAAPAEQGAEQDTEQSSGAPPADTEQEETPQEQDSDGSKARAVSPSAAAGAASPSAAGAAGSDGEAKMDENSAEALETEYLRQPGRPPPMLPSACFQQPPPSLAPRLPAHSRPRPALLLTTIRPHAHKHTPPEQWPGLCRPRSTAPRVGCG